MNVLYQDKANLLNELQSLRQRNFKLELDLKDLLYSYDTKRENNQSFNLNELEAELEQMKQEHQNMKENYDYKLDLLRIRLEKISQENQQLKNENQELIQQQNIKQQQNFEQTNKKSILQDSQIDNFSAQVTKLRQVINEKIVKKTNKSQKKKKQ